MRVEAFSLNRGECRRLGELSPRQLTGWDLAGVVERGAADGSGPAEGSRVVGLTHAGAWAELAAVRTDCLAALGEGVESSCAATLPVAGMTALIALEEIGCVIGKRVLVSGATGGVGSFAVQLAGMAGADVIAVSRSAVHAGRLEELGAGEVVRELCTDGEDLDAVIEGVGGASLGAAIQRIAPGGTIVSLASSDTSEVAFPSRSFFARAPGARLYGLFLFWELERRHSGTALLGRLARLVSQNELDCSITLEDSWHNADAAISALMERRLIGKAVLHVE